MDNMVSIYLYGKKYEVPSNLTIMGAMEYAGYQLIRGLRMQKRILRCLRDDIQGQGRQRA